GKITLLFFFLFSCCFSGFGQTDNSIQVSVVDSLGNPVANVGVVVKGTSQGGATDENGKLSFESSEESGVLLISHQNYEPQQLNFGANKRKFDVTLISSDNTNLEEVVVTGFGLEQKKELLTSAISTVKSDDIQRSNASTASGALVGKIAGLNSRQSDGRPGASTSLQIRNMGDPLYVIDGVQKDAGQFNNLNFNDIENVSILKDASAAIYGVRAANGVIVVT